MNAYESAKYYTENLGWVLTHIPKPSKNPGAEGRTGWQKLENAHTTPDHWHDNPTHGIGLLHEHSKTAIIDVDHLEYTRIIFDELGFDYDDLLKDTPRIKGRDGRDKAVFLAPPDHVLKAKKLWWPDKDNKSLVGIFELRGGPVQDVMPPSIHPDTGRPYEWVKHPRDGIRALPDEFLELWLDWDSWKPQLENMCPWKTEKSIPKQKRRSATKPDRGVIAKYNETYRAEDVLQSHGYIKKGRTRMLSPSSSTKAPGIILFDDGRFFSHHSDIFGDGHSHDAFDAFVQLEHRGDVKDAIKAAEKEFGMGIYDPEPIIDTSFLTAKKEPKKKTVSTPDHLLRIPGILQQVVDYYNETAIKPQPQFAVQVALAIGSVSMGRRFCTDYNNYPNLYLICIGLSSSGKEHIKGVIDDILVLANVFDRLHGPSKYSSGSAVFSALIHRPVHITIIDEIGRYLNAVKGDKNSHLTDAQTQMMEVFGRAAGIHVKPQFSELTSTKAQKEELNQTTYILRPSITVIGMSVPGRFYEALSNSEIVDGYLPRYLIVESDIGRQVGIRKARADVSPELIEWIRNCAFAYTGAGNITDPNENHPIFSPDPVIIPISDTAMRTFDEFEAELNKFGNRLDAENLGELTGKTREIAQRVALIVAVSDGMDEVLEEHAQWAIDYVRYYTYQTIDKVRGRVSNNVFEAACKEVCQRIRETGERGMTESELSRKSAVWRGSNERERESILTVLKNDGYISFQTVATKGRNRDAWFYILQHDL